MRTETLQHEQVQLTDYLRMIWKKKWLVLFVAGSVFGISMWRTLRTEPLYEAMTTVQLNPQSGPVGLDRLSGFMGGSKQMETEIEILKSRVIAEKTAVRLGRYYNFGPLPPGVSLEVTGVTVTDRATPGVYVLSFIDESGQYRVSDPKGNLIGVGRAGQPFEGGGLSFTLSKVSAKSGDSVQIHVPKLANVANSLRGSLKVEMIRGTDIIKLRVILNDPQEATRTANAFAGTYVDFTREQRVQQLVSVRQFLERQIDTFRQDLLKSGQMFSGSRSEKTEPQAILGQLKTEEAIRSPVGAPPGMADIRYDLAKRLLELEMQRAAWQFQYTPNHRVIAQLDREAAEIRNRLGKQFQLDKQDPQLVDLLRQSQIKLSIYTYMLQKQQETRLAEASESGSARIIDPALLPERPFTPNVSRDTKFGLLVGLSLGIGLALFLGYLDRSVKNVKDLEDRVGLPVYGAIPEIMDRRWDRDLRLWPQRRELRDPTKLLMDNVNGRSRAAEAYRALRTSIQFAMPGAPSCVFLITSAGPGEGKSLTVANLAIAMAQMERKVLVVDADLRKPSQDRLFGLAGHLGMTDVLAKRLPWREVVKPTRVGNIDLIPAGRTPPNPVELLMRETMKEFLEETRQLYDMVFIDSPPILLFTDPCVLAPLANGVFLIARSGTTTPEALARARSTLGAVNATVAGAILNAVSHADGFGSYGSGYGYYYDSHYYHADGDTANDSDNRWRSITRRVISHIRKHLP